MSGNAVLDRLLADRDKQIELSDSIMGLAEREGRDLVKAERDNLEAVSARIGELDEQIEPLVKFEKLRESHASAQARTLGRPGADPTTGSAPPARVAHTSLGAFIRDHVRAHDPQADSQARANAAARVALTRAVENQLTSDTPGLLPEAIVGAVINMVDASRPFITSIGAKDLGGVPGKTFHRPKVTQQPLVGKQVAEKTQVPSRKMIIGDVPMTKETYGGVVDISRQDIDWTSPSAWDILLQGLADAYAMATEDVTADAFAAAVTQTHAAASDDLAGLAGALYDAAADVYRGCKRLPDRIWLSLDMWAKFGPMIDVATLVHAPGGNVGESSLDSFAGNMFQMPRIVVPDFPDGTAIIGNSAFTEFYEDRIGIISAVEPSLLGVEVAYGGYVAYGTIEPLAFSKVTAFVAGP